MSWTTDRKYVVYKTKNNTYHWDNSEYMFTYKDFDELVPILFTDRIIVALETLKKLKDHDQRQAR